uniref:Nidogen 2 n=1 Tax=Lepisosteus oculatus TaxID=7918 RepID=W5N2B6_LEPOC|nr:PREDICTED: nidogen-2 [Lepisosteus oculatus]
MWDKVLTVFFLKLSWTVYIASAIQRTDLFPYGTQSGDLILQEGDDETSEVLRLKKPMFFYEAQFSELYVATNGIISAQDLPRETQYVDDGFPTDFPVIAPFLADIDTSKGKGTVFYRLDESPSVLLRAGEEVKRGFPDSNFTPTHAVIATWENVGLYEELTRNSEPSNRVNTFQAVLAYDETNTYALFLYPEDGLQFFGTRPKESYNVHLELPARVGFSRGEITYLIFSRTEGPYYSVTSTEQTVKDLYQVGNSGVPGLWLFHMGSSFTLPNVVPAVAGGVHAEHGPVAPALESASNGPLQPEPDYPEEDYPEEDYEGETDLEYPTTDLPDLASKKPTVLLPSYPGTQELGPASVQPPPYSVAENGPDSELDRLYPEASNTDLQTEPPRMEVPATQASLSRASRPRANPQLRNLPSEDGKAPEPSTSQPAPAELDLLSVYPIGEVVPILESTPPHNPGGHVVSVDEVVNFDSGVIEYSTENKETCSKFQQHCSQYGYCTDYSSGFCCHCQSGYYGNGRHCLPNGAPQRVNGRVSGQVSVGATPVDLSSVDLHAYVVVSDGRAYTAISQIPEPAGWALMPLSTIGGLFGWLLALELQGSENGFSVTGAEFTRYAEVTFYPGNQRLSIVQTAQGLDSHNYLTVDTRINGEIPFVPPGATVQIEPFKETYHYHPSVVTSSSVHQYKVMSLEQGSETFSYQLRQNVTYRDCRHGPQGGPAMRQLSVERVFIMYTKEEHTLRFAVTSQIGPFGVEPTPVNPCYKGTHECDTSAQCLPGEGTQYQCQCATGYRGDGRNCFDIDECTEGLSSCGAHSVCINLQGSHRCECQNGYEFGFDKRTCIDIDECRTQRCHPHAICYNTLGSYDCQCLSGYEGDGFQCILHPVRPKTQCEQHRDGLQGGLRPRGHRPSVGTFVPQCDEEGNYRPLQCHGSTGHCWCVDSSGQERVGTRTPPGTPPVDCMTATSERPRTQCEQHRDGLLSSLATTPIRGAFVPQCDERGSYRPLQCHSSTEYCWCVDSNGQERAGTRTPPGTALPDCDLPGPLQRPETVCERWKASLIEQYGGQPAAHQFLPQCDELGQFKPLQCYGENYCWCVDKDGREVPGTRSQDTVKPACVPTVAPPIVRPTPRPDVTPPPKGTALLYAQGQQIGTLPLNGTDMDKQRASVLLALHGSIVVGIDYDCREKKVYWTDLAGRTINRASLELGAEPETVINTGLLSPEGLAIDSQRRTMFWVDSGLDKIEKARLDGGERKVMFDTDLVNPRAIVVDSLHGNLYWTDWNREGPKIESCTVEGHNRRVLVRDGIGLPNALTFDPLTKQLCWADAGTKRLECIAPDGTERRIIHSNLNYPFSLVAYSNHFYYTDWRRDGVIGLSRGTSQFTDTYLPDQRSHLYGITVAYSSCVPGRK